MPRKETPITVEHVLEALDEVHAVVRNLKTLFERFERGSVLAIATQDAAAVSKGRTAVTLTSPQPGIPIHLVMGKCGDWRRMPITQPRGRGKRPVVDI